MRTYITLQTMVLSVSMLLSSAAHAIPQCGCPDDFPPGRSMGCREVFTGECGGTCVYKDALGTYGVHCPSVGEPLCAPCNPSNDPLVWDLCEINEGDAYCQGVCSTGEPGTPSYREAPCLFGGVQ